MKSEQKANELRNKFGELASDVVEEITKCYILIEDNYNMKVFLEYWEKVRKELERIQTIH